MRKLPFIASALLASLSLSFSGTAFAHAKLLSSTPAANAKASNVRTLSLSFSEKLVDKLSGVDLVMTSMPGMAKHAPMKISGFKTTLSADGKAMTITLPRPLPAGSYDLKWHAVTSDSHRIEGGYSFSVK